MINENEEESGVSQERVVYFNGKIVPESEAKISFRDKGFISGDAVFDVTRTFGKKIFKLQEHLDRYYDSLRYMRLDPGMPKDEMAKITMHVLEANLECLGENEDYWVAQRISRGIPSENKPTVIIECAPLPLAIRAKFYKDGLPVITPSIRRTPPECMSPRAKVHNYINLILADMEVKTQNPDALAVLLDMNGNLAEGSGANFFIVKNGVVKTPKEKKKRPEKTIGDMDGLIEKIVVPMKKSQVVRFAIDGGHGSYYVANKEWKKIAERLFKNEKGLFLNYDPNDENQLPSQIKK